MSSGQPELFPQGLHLADHIALQEVGAKFDLVRVDLVTKRTATGVWISSTSTPNDGELLTENVAILDWIAAEHQQLGASGERGRARLIEALTFISTELHHSFRHPLEARSDEEADEAEATIAGVSTMCPRH